MIREGRAEVLITGGMVVTMEDENVIENGVVATRGDSILFVGTPDELQGRSSAKSEIDASGCVVMPGLVNGHTHAAMALFRGMRMTFPLSDG
jgi:5-methylthioadenosine/S-adenosylhomocysteine deaminase